MPQTIVGWAGAFASADGRQLQSIDGTLGAGVFWPNRFAGVLNSCAATAGASASESAPATNATAQRM